MIKHSFAGVMYMNLIAELKQKQTEMVSWRQHLHQFPEIAYEEAMTSDFVAAKLESFGIEVHRGLGKTGVVGVIHGLDSDNDVSLGIGLRADMDVPDGGTDQQPRIQTSQPHACLWS